MLRLRRTVCSKPVFRCLNVAFVGVVDNEPDSDNVPLISKCHVEPLDYDYNGDHPLPRDSHGRPVVGDVGPTLIGFVAAGPGSGGGGTGNPWGTPALFDDICWNSETLMSGSVPVSCTGLRYSHSATLAGDLTVDKWSRRSCPHNIHVDHASSEKAAPDGSSVSTHTLEHFKQQKDRFKQQQPKQPLHTEGQAKSGNFTGYDCRSDPWWDTHCEEVYSREPTYRSYQDCVNMCQAPEPEPDHPEPEPDDPPTPQPYPNDIQSTEVTMTVGKSSLK